MVAPLTVSDSEVHPRLLVHFDCRGARSSTAVGDTLVCERGGGKWRSARSFVWIGYELLEVGVRVSWISPPKRAGRLGTEMVGWCWNDANPLALSSRQGLHLIETSQGHRLPSHTRRLLVTAAVDGLQFLHPIKVGDLIIPIPRPSPGCSPPSLECKWDCFPRSPHGPSRQQGGVSDVCRDFAGRSRVPVRPSSSHRDERRWEQAHARRGSDSLESFRLGLTA